ncbi:SRPBCC family protein [Gemmobacter lutimaris]|uniref:SRPBCC family protein n=1 Tax=Gemmobacter lutimaris TaxID=2306023 RepID=A0A398BR01_9RHOB|nr:SRPBCC family protein [Gemmobacter lutimaris]RID92832.1 SRPBCC family protein [Gemmobacter lutimaris]
MKLTTREDIEAPLDFVYGAFADTGHWERSAMRRGADVVRSDRIQGFAPGMVWNVSFVYRSRPRRAAVKLVSVDEPNNLGFQIIASSFDAHVTLDFVELSSRRTRVTITSEVKPRTLAARVFVQSMKLARNKVERKYEARIGLICNDIEERYRTRR